jgi:urea transport system substrate-binding protein
MSQYPGCPSSERLEDLLANRLPTVQAAELREHIASCPSCGRRLRPAPAAAAGRYPFLAPPAEPGELGRLGDYRIRGLLGQGGMAVVFDAEDPHLRRPVALKVLPPGASDNLRKRFLREARALASLPGDQVVHVYAVGEADGVPFYAMEKLDGESLQARLARDGWLPVAEALAIAREVAEGLAIVHDRGLIHRDIKPANIWLARTPARSGHSVKLIDFGIARAAEGSSSLTSFGQVIGTPAYMAPEQAAGQPTGTRADLFGLGCVLYQMITGRAPFDQAGTDTLAVLQAVLTGTAPDVQEQAPHLSAPVAGLIRQLLAPAPDDRPASAQTVVEQLRRLEREERHGAARTRVLAAAAAAGTALRGLPRRPRLLGLLLGGLAVVAALAVGVVTTYYKLRPGGAPANGRPAEDQPGDRPAVLSGPPIKIGFLFSLSGPLAIHEQPVSAAAHLAAEEINAQGGVLGRPVEVLDADGASDTAVFVRQARRLLREEKVEALFGCWTSAARKGVAAECAQADRLLFYPCQYEGLEDSPQVAYLGGTPNQTAIPLVHYAYTQLRKRRFFLVGTETVYSHALGEILRHEIEDKKEGLGASVLGTRYLPLGDTTAGAAIAAEVKAAVGDEPKPDVLVISSLDSTADLALCHALRQAGLAPPRVPTAWLLIGETELALFRPGDVVGDYTAACYFESLDTPANRAFVRRMRQRYRQMPGVNDAMETAYMGVFLWQQAVQKAASLQTPAVREALRGLSVAAPEGPIRIDPVNLHAWRTARVGEVARTGPGGALQFEIVFQSPRPVNPEPFLPWRTRQQWDDYLKQLYTRWGNAWEKPR